MHSIRKLYLALILFAFVAAGIVSAQTISIVTGDGLILTPTSASATLTVVVKNAQGQPVANTPVTWTLSGASQGSIKDSQTVTDSNGLSSNQFTGGVVTAASYAQTTITASALNTGVNFTATTSGTDPRNSTVVFVQPVLLAPNPGDVISGAAGSTGTTPVKVQISATGFQGQVGVPNVLVRLIPTTTGGPTIACNGNSGYSDGTGAVNCFPVFGGTLGSGQFTVDVGGGFRIYGPFSFTVTQSQVGAFRITGGNNQTGSPNATLPLPLTARVEDAAGNPLANVPVIWAPVTAGSVTISNASTASDASGNVSATVKLGTTPGNVQVKLSNQSGTIQTLFTAQVTIPITGITKVTGDAQTAGINTAFAQPLIVQVNSSQGPAAGVQVQFTATGAGVTLANNGVATTNQQGQASMAITAGSAAGAATVIASVSNFTASFNLTIRLPGPAVSSSSFFNGAGGQAGGVSPTAVLAIYGSGIAPGIQGCVQGYQIVGGLPIVVSNVTVLFTAGTFAEYAPIYSVCNLGPGQEFVNLQVPAGLPAGVTSVTVRQGSAQTQVDNVPVTVVSPGIFETVMSDTKKRAVVVHAVDGSFVSLENRARPGEALRAFVTGLGRPVSKSGLRIGTNQGGIPADDASPTPAIVVGVNNEGIIPTSVTYSPGLIGVYQVDFVAPVSVPPSADINFAVAANINDSLVFGNPSKIPFQ
jgi:uncharacterized protein (TIGR03437 family)